MAEVSRRWSPYTYGKDNPIKFIDPDGMIDVSWLRTTENFRTVDDPYYKDNGEEDGDKKKDTKKKDEKKDEKPIDEISLMSSIAGVALARIPNAAANERPIYSTYLITKDGRFITVGDVKTFERLISKGYKIPIQRRVIDLVLKNSALIESAGKFLVEDLPVVLAIYDIATKQVEYNRAEYKTTMDLLDLRAAQGSTVVGATVGLLLFGAPGAVVGYCIDKYCEYGYEGFKWIYFGVENLARKIYNPGNWFPL